MDTRPRTGLAIAVATASLTLGILALVIGRVDIGVEFAQDGDYLRIVDVRRNSPAQIEGFDVGMVVVSVNDLQLLRMPEYYYPEPTPEPEPTPKPEATETSEPSPAGSPVPSTSPETSSPVAATTAPDASASPPATPAPVASPTPSPTPSPSPDAGLGGVLPDDPNAEGGAGQPDPSPFLDPPAPTPIRVDPYQLVAATSAGIHRLEAISAVDLAEGTADHPVVREGTAALLAAQPRLAVVGTAGSLDEARALLARVEADVVLLDIRLGGESGLGLLGSPDPRTARRPAIVVLTAYDYPQYAEAALPLGAAGFVLKTAPLAELVDAIRRAADGGLAFGVRPPAPAAERPTAREMDVVRLVADGLSNDEIGAALGIGARTVETHLRRLFERFAIASRTELATRALREGRLEIPPS